MINLSHIFKKSDKPINSNKDFWDWFVTKEQEFHQVVENHINIEQDFLNIIEPKLKQLNPSFWYLSGMFDETTAELIITPDGEVKNIVFVEEFIAAAPIINGWKFSALKPPIDIKDVGIQMEGIKFNSSNLSFIPVDDKKRPDEISLQVFHSEYSIENKKVIESGIFIFLDNYLGELNFATSIDNVEVCEYHQTEKEKIPISKLLDYLNWRQKEFIEKYEGLRKNTEEDSYQGLETTLQNGSPLIATVNTDLLNWESKASHPWLTIIEIKYLGQENNGMPDNEVFQMLNEIEEEIMSDLKDIDGYLNVGRETGDNMREVYFACKEFRKPSKVMAQIKENHSTRFDIEYRIFKDKYWSILNQYMDLNLQE